MKKLNELLFFVAIYVICACTYIVYSVDVVDGLFEFVKLNGGQVAALSLLTAVLFYLLYSINEKLKS